MSLLWLAGLALQPPAAPAGSVELVKPVWTKDPALIAASESIKPYELGTAWYWYAQKPGGGYDVSRVDSPTVRKRLLAKKPQAAGKLFVMDIERLGGLDASNEKTFEYRVSEISKGAKIYREMAADRRIGYYDFWYSSYWTPATFEAEQSKWRSLAKVTAAHKARERWQANNSAIAARFGPLVDFCALPIYPPYQLASQEQRRRWRIQADANVLEAGRLYPSKPVYVFIQPNLSNGDPLNLSGWKMVAEFCAVHSGIDGVIVFDRPAHPGALGWREVFLEAMKQ